jgi:hypothetical protein
VSVPKTLKTELESDECEYSAFGIVLDHDYGQGIVSPNILKGEKKINNE